MKEKCPYCNAKLRASGCAWCGYKPDDPSTTPTLTHASRARLKRIDAVVASSEYLNAAVNIPRKETRSINEFILDTLGQADELIKR